MKKEVLLLGLILFCSVLISSNALADYGQSSVLFSTDFENVFGWYTNWELVDADGGSSYYDAWTRQDTRSNSPDYSIKCSMYDSYKANQTDYLIDKHDYNFSEYNYINISFSIWAEAEDPIDYVLLEVKNLSGEYISTGYSYSNTSSVWLDKNIELTKSWGESNNLNWENVSFRFKWYSDGSIQYEGIYIDDYSITGTTNGGDDVPIGSAFPMLWILPVVLVIVSIFSMIGYAIRGKITLQDVFKIFILIAFVVVFTIAVVGML